MPNILKVNNKDTRTSGASTVNFEDISHFTLWLILLNLSKIMLGGFQKLSFQTINLFYGNFEKYIVLWAEKTCWAICFHVYSSNIYKVAKGVSWQCFPIDKLNSKQTFFDTRFVMSNKLSLKKWKQFCVISFKPTKSKYLIPVMLSHSQLPNFWYQLLMLTWIMM